MECSASRASEGQIWRRYRGGGLAVAVWLATGITALAQDPLIDDLHDPAAVHVDQDDLVGLVSQGRAAEAFQLAFDVGSDLFEARFNALDGGGASVGDGQRYTRIPRPDLDGPGQWADHFPARPTGPNAETCSDCHAVPTNDGGGFIVANVHRDPLRRGSLNAMIQRNTPHLFASGAVQRLAEELSAALRATREEAEARALSTGRPVSVQLRPKGIDFGILRVIPDGQTTQLDTSRVRGISSDLVVRPFQWKGSELSLRGFSRDAFHREIGMQAVELVGDGVDGDGDEVVDELTVGDVTAMAVYIAAQPRPATKIELSGLGLLEPALTSAEVDEIRAGRVVFRDAGCAVCHVPVLELDDPVFSEPSQELGYRDQTFPAGQDPASRGVDPLSPVSFDLTSDQPDNQIIGPGGNPVRLGSLRRTPDGKGIVELFGDLRRHDMGPGLAERIDEAGTGASVFLTENLWGVGSTGPYLHDGRATTLTEAILAHGGEALPARSAFVSLTLPRKKQLIAFLDNLVLFVNE